MATPVTPVSYTEILNQHYKVNIRTLNIFCAIVDIILIMAVYFERIVYGGNVTWC